MQINYNYLNMNNYLKYCLLSISCFTIVFSQSDAKIKFNEGIKAYEKGNYEDAQKLFEEAYQNDKEYSKAIYNAGNAAYLNGNHENAENYYKQYIEGQKNDQLKAEAYHNLGNLFYKKFMNDKKKAAKSILNQENSNEKENIEDLKKSIEYYKNALRANPDDDETRYNLSSALKHIPPPPPPSQDKQQQDQQEKKDEQNKEDQQDQEQKNEKEEEEKKDPKQQDQKQQNEEKEEEKEGEISKDQMEKILKDINNEEKKLMEQMMKDSLKTKKGGTKNYKDW